MFRPGQQRAIERSIECQRPYDRWRTHSGGGMFAELSGPLWVIVFALKVVCHRLGLVPFQPLLELFIAHDFYGGAHAVVAEATELRTGNFKCTGLQRP